VGGWGPRIAGHSLAITRSPPPLVRPFASPAADSPASFAKLTGSVRSARHLREWANLVTIIAPISQFLVVFSYSAGMQSMNLHCSV